MFDATAAADKRAEEWAEKCGRLQSQVNSLTRIAERFLTAAEFGSLPPNYDIEDARDVVAAIKQGGN